jgi:hypothetical protein
LTAGGRATRAIVRWQARREAGPWLQSLVGLVLGLSVLPEYARQGGAQLGAALAVTVAVGVGGSIVLALRPGPVQELRSLRYYAAPLYGRELARAHAIVPCVRSLFFVVSLGAGLTIAAILTHATIPAQSAALLLALALGQPVTAAIVLSGCLRRGRDRALYVAMAAVAGCTIELLGIRGDPAAVGAACVAALALGFAALRALGETLARYDPID